VCGCVLPAHLPTEGERTELYAAKTAWPSTAQHSECVYNNSVALVRERIIPTEQPPFVGVVPAFADRRVPRGQRGAPLRP
jgi:hypothetical protein